MLNWNVIKKYFLKQEELTAEEEALLNAEFAKGTKAPAGVGNVDPGAPAPTTIQNLPQVQSLVDQVSKLTEVIMKGEKEKEELQKSIAEKAKAEAEEKKKALFERAVKAAVIAPGDEEGKKMWESLYDANPEVTAKKIELEIKTKTEAAAQEPAATGSPAQQQTQTMTIDDARKAAKVEISKKFGIK